MVTGRTIQDIINEVGDLDEGVDLDRELRFLQDNGIPFSQIVGTTLFDGTYLITVPSLSGYVPVKHHRIVVTCKDGRQEVHDPMRGRGNYYSNKSFMHTLWSQIVQVG
jgi:hypothetical protein